MVRKAAQKDIDMAEALLDIVPGLLRRLGADLPSEDSPGVDPGWRDVIALRATPGQLSVLSVLVEHKRCTMQQLADHLAVAPSTATAMVKRLLAQGYIERNRDDADWRTVWVRPTEAGCQAVRVVHEAKLASLKTLLEQLSHDERASIMAALPALYHLIEL
ncbi:MAG TPA: MarR family winged helix-turn-helix transcriptional regulator [Ktedonobacteraceae bacterium]|jgi:DNA-binding MarR family transcriptional regulator|nr:MarR family winged helix-turn-helix transcriptional regulator [Ktedonobacteraceae bacterium]